MSAMESARPQPRSEKADSLSPDRNLGALRAWAQQQRFSPPWWLRQADLQTCWYVVREVAAGLRDRRITASQIWHFIIGQEKNYFSQGRREKSRRPDAAHSGEARVPAGQPLGWTASEPVEIPFGDGGFLTGLLDEAGGNSRLAILFHGLEGSAEATYIRGTAQRLSERSISALRVNMVNCGGSEACTQRFYHAGFTQMVEISVRWSLRRGFRQIALIGFSLGGNLVLKYLGDCNVSLAPEVVGGAAASAPIDLAESCAYIDRPRNRFYRYRFLRSMSRTLRRKQQLFPDLFPVPIEPVTTIREFDHRYTAPASGFAGAAEYYQTASSLQCLAAIGRPVLVLQAHDDLYIPFKTFQNYPWSSNPNLIPLFPWQGGHLGFHASARENWMEATVAEFCDRLMV